MHGQTGLAQIWPTAAACVRARLVSFFSARFAIGVYRSVSFNLLAPPALGSWAEGAGFAFGTGTGLAACAGRIGSCRVGRISFAAGCGRAPGAARSDMLRASAVLPRDATGLASARSLASSVANSGFVRR